MAVSVLSLSATVLILVVGLAFGARFYGTVTGDLEAVGFLLLAIISAAGLGLLIGSYTKLLLATFFTGLGISLVMAFTTGIFIPYELLPPVLRAVARFYPISSATSSATFLLFGEGAAGYNPLHTGQIVSTVLISIGFLCAGVLAYSRHGWKRD